MSLQASFALRGRNPDVLTCIANLSNDEVFTPPEFANRMLDTLAEGWAAANKGADLFGLLYDSPEFQKSDQIKSTLPAKAE